ncbi:hypothetical protein MRB53_042194 [Persea americana]|nr:hypothetical protein MRB53_042194 [Persea americana]
MAVLRLSWPIFSFHRLTRMSCPALWHYSGSTMVCSSLYQPFALLERMQEAAAPTMTKRQRRLRAAELRLARGSQESFDPSQFSQS